MRSLGALTLWARCSGCLHWFPVDANHGATAVWQCPLCGDEPDRLENRAWVPYTTPDDSH